MQVEQKMKAIEDDMVPFGVIDDGSSYIDQIEREDADDRWSTTVVFDPNL